MIGMWHSRGAISLLVIHVNLRAHNIHGGGITWLKIHHRIEALTLDTIKALP
jgi:hypothetical protein